MADVELMAETGNVRAIRHGANTEMVLTVVAQDLCEALIGTYPWFIDADAVGIEQYCRIEARARILGDYLEKKIDKVGVGRVPAHLWSAADRADANAMRAAEAIGLTPMGRMKIAKDAGFAQHFSTEKLGKLHERGAALRAAGGR